MSDEFHPAMLGAEVSDLESGTFQNIGDGIRYGVPSALTSAALGIYNSLVFKESEIDIKDAISQYSENAGNYYADHKQGIDLVGGIAGAFIPGTLGVKALQAARAGSALGSVGKILNLTASKKEHYLKAALQEIGSTGGIVPKLGTSNRLKYVAYEAADQALLSFAFEAATVAFMHDAPMFDTDSVGDFAKNMAIGTVAGGVVGGAINSLMAKGMMRNAADAVQERSRAIDVINQADNLGLSEGNKSYQLAQEIAMLPEVAQTVPIKYSIDGKIKDLDLQTGAALQAAKDRAVQTAEGKLRTQFTALAEEDAAFGQAYYKLITEGLKTAKEFGKTGSEAVEIVHGYLQNVAKVGAINLDRYNLDQTKFYIDSAPKGDTAFDRLVNTFTPKRSETTSKQAYRLADESIEKVVMKNFDDLGAKNLKEAFRNNLDVDMIRTTDGRLAVNPYSERVKRVGDKPYTVRKYVHTETGAITDKTVPTFADIAKNGEFGHTSSGISAGAGSKYNFPQPASVATTAIANPLAASARWAWAHKMEAAQLLRVTGGVIDSKDLPLITRLSELNVDLSKFTIKEGDELLPAAEFMSLREAVMGYRRDALKELALSTSPATASSQHYAAYLNTPMDFVEELISKNFRITDLDPTTVAKLPDTSYAMQPKNIMVEWNFGSVKSMLPERAYEMNMGPSHLATKELTKAYQMQIRKDIGVKAHDLALGKDAALFAPAPDAKTGGVTADGAGATMFGASNADYVQRAKLWVQDTGKQIALTTQRWRDAAIETLSPAINGIRGDLRASAELGSITTALRKSELRFSIVTNDDGAKMLVSREAKKIMETPAAKASNWDEAIELASGDGRVHSYPLTNESVIDFLEGIVKQNDGRVNKFTNLYNASGISGHFGKPGEIYVPPINTQKYPFFALVKTKNKVGLGSDTTMITAKSEEQLREYAASLANDYDIFYKADTAEFHKAMGDYQYSMTINENTINSDLLRRGKLADAIPETRPENVLTDWLEWTSKQEEKLVRTAVQVGNRQFFSELQFLSENYRMVSESQARGLGSALKSKIQDPFGDYIKTALNISKQGEFPLLDSLNEFVDKIGYSAGTAIARAQSRAQAGVLPWQDAQKVMNEYGIGQGLTAENYRIANEIYPSNLIKDTLAKGNMWLANTTLRFDFINPLINMISTPIMIGTEVSALRKILAGDSKLAADFDAVMKVMGPDGRSMPSTTKLLSNSINNFFGKDKAALLTRYRDIGAIKEISQIYHEVLDSLSFKSVLNPSKYAAKIDAAVEAGSKITGNTFMEDFTRFVSADVMRQISEPLVAGGKLTAKEQNAFISTFVNRVQGNYVTSQRPIVFQGTTGAAVSLFQTYAFNVLQQLTRHIQNGDKRTMMIFAGLQGSIFGLNGLPFFDAINTHLVGSWLANNPQHNDAYNILPKFNKELGDWALYGSASAFPLFGEQAPALYTRGDINPRHITILPTSFADIPIVSAANKAYDTVAGLGKNIAGGGDISQAMLRAMEHQGWNRPLAGMAQVFNGQSTTSKGALISAANEFDTTAKMASLQDRMIDFGGIPRMLGARPMDESIALNNLYRNKSYDALDKERIDRLGQIVKTKLANNEAPTKEDIEDFMLRYTRIGGRIENFSSAMQRWSKDSHVSIINQTMQRVGSNSGMKLQAIMGGEGLEDRLNQTPLGEEE